jgi:hypothetical protein
MWRWLTKLHALLAESEALPMVSTVNISLRQIVIMYYW